MRLMQSLSAAYCHYHLRTVNAYVCANTFQAQVSLKQFLCSSPLKQASCKQLPVFLSIVVVCSALLSYKDTCNSSSLLRPEYDLI